MLVVGAVPGWVSQWCRARGRELLPVDDVPSTAGDEPGRTRHARVVAAFPGRTVLVQPEMGHRDAPPVRVVAALRRLPEDAHVLGDAAEAAAQLAVPLTILHAVPLSFGERSVGLEEALDRGRRVLRTAVRQAGAGEPALELASQLLRARPHELVGDLGDDALLVIGGPRQRGAVGLVTNSALHHAPCPVLVAARPVRPGGTA